MAGPGPAIRPHCQGGTAPKDPDLGPMGIAHPQDGKLTLPLLEGPIHSPLPTWIRALIRVLGRGFHPHTPGGLQGPAKGCGLQLVSVVDGWLLDGWLLGCPGGELGHGEQHG